MGREVFKYTEIDSNDFQRVNQSTITMEIFHTASYATAIGTTTLKFADRGGFLTGDLIYVGTNIITGGVTLAGTETIGAGNGTIASAAHNNNDAIVLYSRTGTARHATVYDDPDFTTSIDQTDSAKIALDSNNEIVRFLKPGAYGIVFKETSGGTVLRSDYFEVIEELDWVTVTPGNVSNTAGIGEAIRRLNTTSGGKVYIPAGTFDITTAIKFLQLDGSTAAPNIHISGAGAGLTILKVPNGTGAITNGIFDLGTVNNVTISDMTINGNQADATNGASPAEDYAGIYSDGSDEINIQRVRIIQCRYGVYATTGTNTRWTIEECNIIDIGGEGILLEDMNQCNIINNKIVTTGDDGIAVAGSGNTNDQIIISLNNINRTSTPTRIVDGGSVKGALIKLRNTDSFMISNNIMVGQLGDSSMTAGIETDGTDTNHGVITNNTVRDTELAGIQVPNNTVIDGNYIFNAGEDGIKLESGGATAFENVTITNNSINDCNETTNTDGDVAGIHIDCLNTVGTPPTIKHLVISNNTTYDSRGTERMDYNFIIQATVGALSITKATITGNDFSSLTDGDIAALWTAVNVTSVPEITWRNNTMPNAANDEYYGVATLVAGTFAIANAQWPGHTGNRFNISRTDDNGGQTGHLEGVFDGTNTLTVNSYGSSAEIQLSDIRDNLAWTAADAGTTVLKVQTDLPTDVTMTSPEAMTVRAMYFYVRGVTAGTSIDYNLEDSTGVDLTSTVTVTTATSPGKWHKAGGNGVATVKDRAFQIVASNDTGNVTAVGVDHCYVMLGGGGDIETDDVSKVYWEFVGTPPATA